MKPTPLLLTTMERFGPVGMSIDLIQPAFTMRIKSIEEGSPAAATGKLKAGQIIDSINGAFITQEWLESFAKGEVIIAVKSFLRFNDKYRLNRSKPEPQGLISVDIEEQKLPPMGDDLVRGSAKSDGMLSSEWQAAQFSDSGQTDTIEAFNPAKPSAAKKPVATTLQLADKGETGHPLLKPGWISPWLVFKKN